MLKTKFAAFALAFAAVLALCGAAPEAAPEPAPAPAVPEAEGGKGPPVKSFDQVLPEDTVLLFDVKSWRDLQDRAAKLPIFRAVRDPASDKFFAKAKEKFDAWLEKFRREQEFDLKEAVTTIPSGEIAFAVVGSKAFAEKLPAFVVLADVGERKENLEAVIEKILEKTDAAKWERKEQEAQGEKVTVLREPEKKGGEGEGGNLESGDEGIIEDGVAPEKGLDPVEEERNRTAAWAFSGDRVFVLANDVALLEKTLANLKGAEARSLSESADYQAVKKALGDRDDAIFYLDLQRVVSATLAKGKGEEGGVKKKVDPEKLMEALGISAFRGVGSGFSISDEGRLRASMFLHAPGERRGLLKMLVADGGEVAPPAYVPRDAASFWTGRLDAAGAWKEFLKIMEEANPDSYQVFRMTLNSLASQNKINLEKDLIEMIGDRVVAWERYEKPYSPETARNITHLAVKDRKKVEGVLGGLLGLNPMFGSMFKSEDYMGHNVRRFAAMGGGAPAPAFTVTDELFVIGNHEEAVKGFVRSREKAEEPLADRAEFRELLARLGDRHTFFAFTDDAKFFEVALTVFLDQAEKARAAGVGISEIPIPGLDLGDGEDVNLGELFDLKLLPEPKVLAKYFSASAMSLRPVEDGVLLETESLVTSPE